MLQPPTLKITEIFPSIQGEGLRQGEATIFVRLAGCNLRCPFCDTKYAWENGKNYTIEKIVEKVKKIEKHFPSQWLCLTGGEPLLQNVAELIKNLKERNFKIQVETNATLYRDLPVDWYTISPKPEKYFYQPEYKCKAKEVKLIVTRELELRVIQNLRKNFPLKVPILLQPQSNRKWSFEKALKLLHQSLKKGLQNIKISIQLHKIYGIR